MWNSMLPITSGMVSFIGILQENRHKVKLHVFFFRVQHASKQTHVLYFSMFQILILISFHCAAILYFSYSWVLKNLPSKKVLTIERDDIERPRSSARRTSANLFIYANQHAPEFTFFPHVNHRFWTDVGWHQIPLMAKCWRPKLAAD